MNKYVPFLQEGIAEMEMHKDEIPLQLHMLAGMLTGRLFHI
jgi:hypothetical protein